MSVHRLYDTTALHKKILYWINFVHFLLKTNVYIYYMSILVGRGDIYDKDTCKEQPDHVEFGTGIDYMDFEGRNIRADYGDLSIMSMYLPSGTNIDRLDHKLMYMADFQKYADELRKERPNLIVCGDYNICHEAIDIHDPVRNKNVSGFLPVEREWIGNFIDSGFIDSFRHFNKEPDNYTWWSYRANARANNKGWRLDYGMVAEPLKDRLKRSVILSEAKHSDHCPILLEVEK